MSYLLNVLFSFSILIPALTGGIRFSRVHPAYHPFIFCLWLGLANELLSVWTIMLTHSNAVNSNVYVLLEAVILCWQFKRWGLFSRDKWIYPVLIGVLATGWVTENFFISSIRLFSSWFRIGYAFIIVLLSISLVNYQIVRERRTLLRNSAAVISLVFIVYYTYKVLVETFWVYGLNENSNFRTHTYFILAFINVISNLIYALAILWMPIKHRFTLPY